MPPSRVRSSLLLFAIASVLLGGALYGALGWNAFGEPELASAGVVTSQGPVAAYSFDEGEGTTVEDLTGNENTATIEGAEWVPGGKYGGAMKFDSAEEDRLSVPASEDLNTEEEFTLEAWVRPEAEQEEYALILGKENSVSPHFAYVAYADSPYERPEAFFAEGSKGGLQGEGGTPFPHAWTHIAVTDDGAHTRLYVNGQLVDTAESVPIPSTDGDLVIGGNKRFASFFNGKIDEVRIYNRPLSEAEIQADKAAPIQTPQVAPVAEYSFDEGEGTTVEDLTGDGNTATIEGAEWAPRGKYGGAMKFDSAEEDVLTVPAAEDLDLTEEFTLEAWIHPESGHEYENIFEKENSEEPFYSYLLSDHRQLAAYFQEEPAYNYYSPGEEIEPHIWTHVALTYDGARVHLYINGVEVESGPAPSFVATDGALKIGGGEKGLVGGNDFDGKIDEVRVYNRALNEAEVQSDATTPLQTPLAGPVAAYSFDEGEGTTVEDLTGNGNTATIEEGEWTKGKYGGALNFYGGTKCVTVADAPDLQLSEEFTLEAWVRPEADVYEDPVVVREAEGADSLGLGLGSRVHRKAEGFIGERGKASAAINSEETLEHAWTHLATTYDGVKLRLYVDGELVATETATTPPVLGSGLLKIGCDEPDGQFTGRIDEVRVYNRALAEPEVQADMAAPLQTPQQAPVAAYSFDEGTGTTAQDLTGNGHTATIEGAKWARGRYGDGLEFKGSEHAVVKIPSSPGLNFSEEFTLEAWVRPGTEKNKRAPLIDKQPTSGKGVGYFLDEGGAVSNEPLGGTAEEEEEVHATNPLPKNAWSHVALTFTGSRVYLYVNGELADNGVADPPAITEGSLEIGGATTGGQYFNGRIDEVRIYNRALGEAEVAADMKAPIQTPRQEPVAAYSFDEGEGTTVEDLTGNEHTATIEGAEWASGKYGEALKFNGISSCVSIADATDLRLGEEFTLESWVKAEGELKHDPVVFKEGAGYLNYALDIGHATTGKGEGSIGVTASPHHKESASTASLEANVWTHLAVTFDGSKLRLYVNGELADTEAVEGTNSGREGALKIGCDSQYGEHFKGRIDEVRVYTRALSAGEVGNDSGPRGMTATYISNEEGEEVQAEATSIYPQTGTGATATYGAPIIDTSVTLIGNTIIAPGSTVASSAKKQKPYQFAKCEYSHHEPGAMDPGSKNEIAPSPKTLMKIAHEAAASSQKAAKTTKPHGLPNCDGTYDEQYFHFQWGVEIWGDFFYEENEKVWIEEAPQCESWAPAAVEIEHEEYEEEVKEGRHPHLPKRQDARPKEEVCFAPYRESTASPGGIDVLFRISWSPAYLFIGRGSEREKVCGELDGHLTSNPPAFEENGLRQVFKSVHLYDFNVGSKSPCDWAHPSEKVKEY